MSTLTDAGVSCALCVHAFLFGWWGPTHKGTHCADLETSSGIVAGCHRSWAGLREVHCPDCHCHFSADSVADKHRVRGVCLDRNGMLQLRSKTGLPVLKVSTTPNGEMWRGAETLHLKSRPVWADGK